MTRPETEDLLACLAETRAAILAGRIDSLDALAERTAQALAAAAPKAEPALRRIRDSAAENARLLEAALKGVRAARRRAMDLTEQGRFSTYEQGGQRRQPGLATAAHSIRL